MGVGTGGNLFDAGSVAWHQFDSAAPGPPRRDGARARGSAAAEADRRWPRSTRGAGAWLPIFVDDEEVSLGAGTGSRNWPRSYTPDHCIAVDRSARRADRARHGLQRHDDHGAPDRRDAGRRRPRVAGLQCGTRGVTIGGETVALGDYSGPAGAPARAARTARPGGRARDGARRHPAPRTGRGAGRRGGDHQRSAPTTSASTASTASPTWPTPNSLSRVLGTGRRARPQRRRRAAARPRRRAALSRWPVRARDAHPRSPALRAPPDRPAASPTTGCACGGPARRTTWARSQQCRSRGGAARHNVANAAAAALAASGLGVAAGNRGDARAFGADRADNPEPAGGDGRSAA